MSDAMCKMSIIFCLNFAVKILAVVATGTYPYAENPVGDSDGHHHPASTSQSSDAEAAAAAASAAADATLVQNVAGISAGVSNLSLPDPCGPPLQAPGIEDSIATCHLNVSVSDTSMPQAYGVQCLHDNTTYILDEGTCTSALATICYTLSGGHGSPVKDQWVWSDETGNCTFGFWLPTGGAPPPSIERCQTQILAPMKDACQPPQFNVAAINLRELPSAKMNETTGVIKGNSGLPVDGGYLSFIMVAQGSGPGASTPKF